MEAKMSDGWPRREKGKGRVTLVGGSSVTKEEQERVLDSKPGPSWQSGEDLANALLAKERGRTPEDKKAEFVRIVKKVLDGQLRTSKAQKGTLH